MGRDGHRNDRTGPFPPRAHLNLGTGGAGAALLFHIQLLGKKHPEDDYWHRIPPEEERNEGSG